MKRIALALGFVSSMVALTITPGLAQNYPTKTIKIVVPYPAGGPTDLVGRTLADALTKALKQTVIVENKAGAGGTIGSDSVVKSQPDGYTLLLGLMGPISIAPKISPNLPYDPLRDLEPIRLVALMPEVLVARSKLGLKTLGDVVAYGKANPKALTFAAGNTSSHIMGEMFARSTGIEMLRVPYTSNPAGVTDVIAGRVSVMFPDISSSIAHVKSGSLRALAVVTLGERSPMAPELPTVAETVVPNFHFVGWIGLFAPAGTPAAAVARLSAEMQKIMAMPEVAQRFQSMGAEAKWTAPADFRAFVGNEVQRLPKILADIGVVPQ